MKRLILLILLLLLCALSLVFCGREKPEFIFEEIDGEVYIKDYRGDGGVVEVPREIDGKRVVGIGDMAFANTPKLREVTMSGGTKIGKYAFANCKNLEKITVNDKALTLSEGAFYGCVSLKSIDASYAFEIPAYCFYNCSSLSEVTLGES